MDEQRPWSRWLYNLVMPGKYSDTIALRSPRVVLTDSESKLLARYAVASDHLVGPPSAAFGDTAPGTRLREPMAAADVPPAVPANAPVPAGRHDPPPLQAALAAAAAATGAATTVRRERPPPVSTHAALGVGAPPAPPRSPGPGPASVGLGVVGVAVSSGAFSITPSRPPPRGTMALEDDAPMAPPLPASRRPRVLSKLSLASAKNASAEALGALGSPLATPGTPDTPGFLRYPQSKVRPALTTMERVAATALYFEQFYDALARQTSPRVGAIGGGRQRLGRASAASFDFGRVIGQGAFGVVRIAKDKENGRIVAIKQLRKVDLLRMGQEGHVRAEKDLLSAASTNLTGGPSWIPRLYYSFQDRDHLFFALEFMGGGDLLTLLVSRGSLPEPMVRFYAAEMILALHQTHKLGYIHRDVKPDNFLFTSDGHIRIADFGLATDLHWAHDSAYYEHQRRAVLKRHGVPLERPAFGNRRRDVDGMPGKEAPGWGEKGKNLLSWRSKNRRRQAYTICGTNSYMAPEVIRGAGYGFGVDWWSLGVIIYEAIYGTIPFVGQSREHARKKILDWRNQLHLPRRGVTPLALDFMRRLMCDPEDRLGYVSTQRRGSGASSVSVASSTPLVPVGNGTVTILDGPLGHDGVEQLMAHPWFTDIDWSHLHEAVAPFQPQLKSVDDTSHFDEDIPDEPLAPGNSALYLRDPLLGDKICGKDALAIRKALAFKGWTFRCKADDTRPSGRRPLAKSLGAVGSSPYRDSSGAYSSSPHRSRADVSRTLRAPEHEPTMSSLHAAVRSNSGFSDSDSDIEAEVGWTTEDAIDMDMDMEGDDSDDTYDPDPVIETPELDMDLDNASAVPAMNRHLDGGSPLPEVDGTPANLNPEPEYGGYPRPPRRLWPRGYDAFPPRPGPHPHPSSLECAYDNRWSETQQLDWREMLALGHPEDYERPSCVPAAGAAEAGGGPYRSPPPDLGRRATGV